MELIGKTTIHPVLFYTGKAAGYAAWLLPVWSVLFTDRLKHLALHDIAGLCVMTIGLALTAVSMVNLGRSTRLGLPDRKTEFKRGGIYRFSRNPMYLGFDLMTAGGALFALHPAVIAAGVYSMIIYHLIILREEKFMQDRFPEQYPEYRKRVRRYM